MKITALSVVISCLIVQSAFPQQKILEVQLDSADSENLHGYQFCPPDSNSLYLTLSSRNKVVKYRVDSGSETNSHSANPWFSQSYDEASRKTSILPYKYYLGSTVSGNGIEEAFSDKKISRISFVKTFFDGGLIEREDSIVIPESERLINFFSQNNSFYILTLVKGTNLLKIYRHISASKTKILEKEIRLGYMGRIRIPGTAKKKKVSSFSDLISRLGFAYMDERGKPPTLESTSHSKLYIQKDRLYFTFDNHELNTWVIDVPLNDDSVRVRRFDIASYYPKNGGTWI